MSRQSPALTPPRHPAARRISLSSRSPNPPTEAGYVQLELATGRDAGSWAAKRPPG